MILRNVLTLEIVINFSGEQSVLLAVYARKPAFACETMGLNACVITGRATSDAFTKAMPKGRLGRYSETKCRAPLTVRAHHCSCRESEPSVGVPGSPARFFTLSNPRRSFMRLPPQNNSTMRRTILRFRYRTFGKKKRSLRNTITDVWRLYNFVLSKQVALLIEGYNIFR